MENRRLSASFGISNKAFRLDFRLSPSLRSRVDPHRKLPPASGRAPTGRVEASNPCRGSRCWLQDAGQVAWSKQLRKRPAGWKEDPQALIDSKGEAPVRKAPWAVDQTLVQQEACDTAFDCKMQVTAKETEALWLQIKQEIKEEMETCLMAILGGMVAPRRALLLPL